MSNEVKERVIEWLTSPETCFLLGAGCSACAGKPLIGKLTDQVLADVDASIKTQFDGLKPSSTRPATIEDLINYLIRYQWILQTVQNPAGHALQPDWIEKSLTAIKTEIVVSIADKWVPSAVHARFFKRIGGAWSKGGRDIFTLNYDTVIEATLDHLRCHYSDGFRGTFHGWFDPTVFEEEPMSQSYFRVYKLHGSINWLREPSGFVRRAVVTSASDITDPVVVYPSEQKYLQTQFGVYETLIGNFRRRLRSTSPNNCLVTMGYSFNDEHINEAIADAILASGSNLTVIAFIGPDSDLVAQKTKLQALVARCDQRFNVFVGDAFHIGSALDESGAQALLKEGLWRFETLVDYVAGTAS